MMAQRGNPPPWLPPGTRQLGVVGQIVVIIFIYCCCLCKGAINRAYLGIPPPPRPSPTQPPSTPMLDAVSYGGGYTCAHTPLVTCHLWPVSFLSLPLSLPPHPPACRSPSPRGAFLAVACRIDRPSLTRRACLSQLAVAFAPLHAPLRSSCFSPLLLQPFPIQNCLLACLFHCVVEPTNPYR